MDCTSVEVIDSLSTETKKSLERIAIRKGISIYEVPWLLHNEMMEIEKVLGEEEFKGWFDYHVLKRGEEEE